MELELQRDENLALAGGAGIAGAGGGAAASLACGLFAPVCLVYTVPLGAAVGAGIAQTADRIATSMSDLNRQLEAKVAWLKSSMEFRGHLAQSVVREAETRWTLVPDSGLVRVVVYVDKFVLRWKRSDRALLQLEASIVLKWARGADRGNVDYAKVRYEGQEFDVALWLRDDDFIARRFQEAYDDVARRICIRLEGGS